MESSAILASGESEKNSLARAFIPIGIIMAIAACIWSYYIYEYVEGYENFGFGYSGWYYYFIVYDNSFSDFFFNEFFHERFGLILLFGIALLIAGLVLKSKTENGNITVTPVRVYGTNSSGIKFDIPNEQVNGFHVCSFDGVSIFTLKGPISIYNLQNREAIISALRQIQSQRYPSVGQGQVNVVKQRFGGAEELKTLKELLDSGVITQEDFDKKKKQILGL